MRSYRSGSVGRGTRRRDARADVPAVPRLGSVLGLQSGALRVRGGRRHRGWAGISPVRLTGSTRIGRSGRSPGSCGQEACCGIRQRRRRIGELGSWIGYGTCAAIRDGGMWFRRAARASAFDHLEQRLARAGRAPSTRCWTPSRPIPGPHQPTDQRAASFAAMRQFLQTHPSTRDGSFELPMCTLVA